MTNVFTEPEGATPLEDEDLSGLLRTDIALRQELNVAEASNIAAAEHWAFSRTRRLERWLTRSEMTALHKRMFGDVWRWAGTFRRRETSIGIDPYRIVTELENLLADVRAQTANRERLPWSPDEIAARLHHRLVSIHPFPNGNGRHARLAADLVVINLGRPRFTWGHAGHLDEASNARIRYLAALRAADRDLLYGPLMEFTRS
ncbi:MAG: mobile mystery protein B [Longispora sp.]|nr:mobile mystery protein B [Longispora sp. (in: high G+C Gram-positive bacteria)]